jgi:hypothetical protein
MQNLAWQEKEILWPAPIAHVEKLNGLHMFEIFWLPFEPESPLVVHSCEVMDQIQNIAQEEWLSLVESL